MHSPRTTTGHGPRADLGPHPDRTADRAGRPTVKVVKGRVSEEELAAVTAVTVALLARAAGHRPHRPATTTAGWRRLERRPGFRAAHSWQG